MALTNGVGNAVQSFNTEPPSQRSLQHGQLPESTTILIVGGGPVGILSAIAFARYGLDSVVLERHATRLGQPKAHVVSQRSVEIFRQYELDVAYLRKMGLSTEDAAAVVFASAMNGIEYGVLETNAGSAAEQAASPETMFNVAQPLLEEHFLQAALKTGKVTYLRRHEWQQCTEDPATKKIESTVLRHEDGSTQTITSKYLIACDGTNARSRDILQIPFQPLNGRPEVVLNYVSVHFSADLSHLRPGLLWFILNPAGMGIFIAYNRKNSWVFTFQYDPSMMPRELFTSEFLQERLFKAAGGPIHDYKELGITLWTTTPKVAESYRSRHISPAFLAGDAAHTFPPTGGLGMNTGVGDVHNLAWKVHAVEQGWAPDSFLDTVTPERRQVASDNSKQSKINEENIHRLVGAIFGPGVSPEDLWADERSRKDVQNAIRQQSDHFDSLNLQLGYVYGRDHVRGPSDYRKECVPGARLPHAWVKDDAGAKISTLDLIQGDAFVLFTAPNFTPERRLEVQRVPVSVVQLERDYFDPSGEWSQLLGLGEGFAVIVRPDQHIVTSVKCLEEVSTRLAEYLNPTLK